MTTLYPGTAAYAEHEDPPGWYFYAEMGKNRPGAHWGPYDTPDEALWFGQFEAGDLRIRIENSLEEEAIFLATFARSNKT